MPAGDFERAADTRVEALVARGQFDPATDRVSEFTVGVIAAAVGLSREGREHLPTFGALALASSGSRNASFEAALARAQDSGTMQSVQRLSEHDALASAGLGARLFASADAGEITAAGRRSARCATSGLRRWIPRSPRQAAVL